MTANQIQTHARALVARMYPSATDAVVVAVESYGQRRLYPITDAADTIAALVGARTLDERHLAMARRLGVIPRITSIGEIAAPAVDDSARAAWWEQTGRATCAALDEIDDRRRAAARAANRDQRAAYCEAAERGEIPPPPPPANAAADWHKRATNVPRVIS